MDTTAPIVNIIIPNYNGKNLLGICLESIQKQVFKSIVVTIVDNGSSDGSIEFIKNEFPDVNLIVFSENKGFSAAVNAGIKAVDCPYAFLLNNDTELAPDCLLRLIETAGREVDFYFFATKLLSFHNRDVLDGAGDGYLRGGAGYRLGTMEPDSPVYNIEGPVFGACAGAALYRRELFDKIGFFDEQFFAYLEDVDLNLRANRAGMKCYYVPGAKVFHIGCATTGSKFNDTTIRLSTRNSFFVLAKNYSFSLFLRFLPVIFIYQLFWLLFVVKKGKIAAYFVGLFQATVHLVEMHRKRYEYSLDLYNSGEQANYLKEAERRAIDSIMNRRVSRGKGNLLLKFYSLLFL